MIKLVDLTTAIGTWFKALIITHVEKIFIHPSLEAITTMPRGILILSWDVANMETQGFGQNDRVELFANIDVMVPAGKSFECVDSIIAQISANPSLGHVVLATAIQSVDFSNPSQGLEGFTMKVSFTR